MQPKRQAETTQTHEHQSLMRHCVLCQGVGRRREQFQLQVSFSGSEIICVCYRTWQLV
jgi:hypothetical protein